MPKAVAILEGDSSSLVKSINDAKGAMTGMEKEARKLSDQIRDVADEADKAAGALVQRIGGPTAVKAIAGIGAAFAGAQVALGAFAGSMSAFYATQGEEGAKAMADIDMALNKLQSELFTAVMGTDNMEEATQTLIAGIETATTVVEALLTPLKWLGQFLKLLRDFANEGANATKRQADELNRLKTTQALMKQSYDSNQKAIEGNLKAVQALTGATEDNRKAQLQAALTATDAIAQQVLLAEKEQDIADMKAMNARDTIENDTMARKIASDQLRDGLIKADEFNAKMNLYFNNLQKQSRKNAIDTVMVMSEATKTQLASLGAQRQVLAKELLGVTEEAKKEEETKATGSGGDRSALLNRLDAENAAIMAARQQRLEDEEQLLLLYGGRAEGLTREQALSQARINETNALRRRDAEIARLKETEVAEKENKAAREAADKEFEDRKAKREEEAAALEKQRQEQKIANIKEGLQEYGKASMQQLAIGKKASAVAADLARKAIGDAISAKGDEAMAEAAILAAAFNPQAIPMAAAGVAAYAAAAMLGSTAKKSTSSTPAAAAPVQAAPVNTSFNLRVDAAFADGESIARQFAMMQRNAQARGLVPVGA